MNTTPKITTAQRLNLETGRIHWNDLQKFFARGVLIVVHHDLDLVETATLFVEDRRPDIEKLLATQQVRIAGDDDARCWGEQDQEFWAVVTAPWVLVQLI